MVDSLFNAIMLSTSDKSFSLFWLVLETVNKHNSLCAQSCSCMLAYLVLSEVQLIRLCLGRFSSGTMF